MELRSILQESSTIAGDSTVSATSGDYVSKERDRHDVLMSWCPEWCCFGCAGMRLDLLLLICDCSHLAYVHWPRISLLPTASHARAQPRGKTAR